ncbi:MAG: TOBE domain-containing protein, partial [Alphaproteobacteria bacterium]
ASLVKGHEKGDEKGDAATVGIRPEHLHQCSANEALVTAEFDLMENLGEHVLVHLKVSNNGQHPESIIAKFEHAPTFKTGDTVYLKCDADRIYKFDKDGNSN